MKDLSENWLRSAQTDVDAWFKELESHVPEAERANAATYLVLAAARLAFVNEATRLSVFAAAEKFGAHFLPVYFYSPVPRTDTLDESIWTTRYDDLPGLEINEDEVVALLDSLGRYGDELKEVPTETTAGRYYWNNPAFGGGDASLLYSFIRHYQPKRIVEIGSGYSTLIGLQALRENASGAYQCIEPYPLPFVQELAESGTVELFSTSVQEIELNFFETLEENDILFIDSTHVCKTGSDVVYEFLKIVPRLRRGVVVHVHDIFHPFDYPRNWVVEKQIFWNEQYLLLALLCGNPSFKMLLSNQACARSTRLRQSFSEAFPHSPVQGGGSFWFKTT